MRTTNFAMLRSNEFIALPLPLVQRRSLPNKYLVVLARGGLPTRRSTIKAAKPNGSQNV